MDASRMTKRLNLLLAATLLLAGCVDPSKVPNGSDRLMPVERVVEFKLTDGTRCVVAADSRSIGGVTCDWRHE